MTSQPAAPAQGGATINVVLCFIIAVLEGFDIQAIGVAAPRLTAALGLAPDQMGWVFFASNAALVVGAMSGGWLADRVGRKPVLTAAVAIFGAFTLLTAAAQDLAVLFAARIGAGLGFGAALPNMMAIAADISRPDRRASTATAMFCGMPLGGGLAALFIQSMPPGFDWRTVFLVGGALPLVLTPILLMAMRESARPATAASGQPVSAARALFGEGRAAPTLLLWAAFLPTMLILYLILYWLPTLVAARGFEGGAAAQASAAFNFSSVVGALLLGRIVDRWGFRWPLSIVYAALIATIVALASATAPWATLALSAAAGFCVLGANYALYGVAASYYPMHMRGAGSGAAVAAGRVGSTVGPLLPGLLLSAGGSADQVINLMAPAAAAAGVAVFLLGFFKRRAET